MDGWLQYLQQVGLNYQSSVPPALVTLFELEKKSDVEQYSRSLIITKREFVELVLNCSKIGYEHHLKSKQFIPPHLDRNLAEAMKTFKQAPGKMISTVKSIFEERKYLAAHSFVSEKGKWHVFYFDFKDMAAGDSAHWIGGAHTHFVNFLWPQHLLPKLWQDFDERKVRISDNLHIRFDDQ